MGLRETLNENPRLTTGLTIGLIVVVLLIILWNSFGSGGGARADSEHATKQVFFTDDDGKTWFPDDGKKVPPFSHGGKDAVRAYVYRCGGKTFVNHMERYTADGKKKLEGVYASGKPINDPTVMESIQVTGMEVKSPGDAAWVKASDPKAAAIMQPKCSGNYLEVVTP